VVDLSFEAAGWWSYAMVFIAAATPVIEVLVVIPTAIVAGLHPVPTTALALAGNLSTVAVAVLAGDRLVGWWRRRRPRPAERSGGRSERARRLARRWGVPALALLAPISTGSHIAALAALATGAARRRVLCWMAAGLAVWATATGVAAALGTGLFR
jgi:hypothetical protein